MVNFKEWFRKKMVTLKRKPNHIPLTMLIISCLIFNLNLTSFSNTIAQINEPGMGLTFFIVVLCSYLSIISFILAFPNRKKPKIVSIVLVCFMLLLSIAGQLLFHYFIIYGTEIKPNPVVITEAKNYINVAKRIAIIHVISCSITFLLIITMPLYRKLLQKINTTVTIAEMDIDDIEFIEEDEII
jgi:glucan phosphoethanolaminetransferase (alkaline phosphatase superfamily)